MDPDAAKWANRGTLSVLLPNKTADGLDLGDPIRVTDNCMAAGSGGHSGGTLFAVTVGQRTHVVYAQCPDDLRHGGNLIYIATIDRMTRKVLARQFLVNAPPNKAAVHTRPTISADSKGHLHVLSGSHGQPFYYLRSLKPGDISGGWTEPTKLTGRQRYASIVCDANDQLHSVFREWISHASRGYSTADAGEGKWTAPRTLVQGALPRGKYEYGIFYPQLFIDRAHDLYLSFTFLEFRAKNRGNYPQALAVSADGDKNWRLASTCGFQEAIQRTPGDEN